MDNKYKLATIISFFIILPLITNGENSDKIGKIEKDRRAILSMAGEYEVTFKFMETIAISDDYELKKPYLADATEIIFVIKNSPKNITLQHILWLEDLERVVKHWKQEWKYEDRTVFEFIGNNTWKRILLDKEKVQGTWSQKVYQVDDSPRYESYGTWIHYEGMSSWQGNQTRRPLPRREYTKRDDYDVFMAVNRHTITSLGWYHEQDNYKKVSDTGVVLCREAGLNNYERTKLVDFSQPKKYWNKNSNFWAFVSSILDQKMENSKSFFSLKSKVGDDHLYTSLFKLIKEVDDEDLRKEKAKATIESFVIMK
ncbi:MAG: DUF6607 family protein [Verrucomicrobiota bacterium]|nr:DUF6607 family protein [Verrucomicrobiota bacterium]